MTDSNYTHLLVIVDRSASMRENHVDVEMRAALDKFFDEQAELDGKCLVDYVQFDDEYEVVFTDRPVAEASAVLNPRGWTALLDAVGKASTDFGEKLAKLPEDKRPGNVIVAVITDGYENSSKEWTAQTVKELIKNQEEKYNWTFTFLGANMDAVAVGQSFGFNPNTSLTFNVHNTGAASASLSGYTTRARTQGVAVAAAAGYSDEDRQSQGV